MFPLFPPRLSLPFDRFTKLRMLECHEGTEPEQAPGRPAGSVAVETAAVWCRSRPSLSETRGSTWLATPVRFHNVLQSDSFPPSGRYVHGTFKVVRHAWKASVVPLFTLLCCALVLPHTSVAASPLPLVAESSKFQTSWAGKPHGAHQILRRFLRNCSKERDAVNEHDGESGTPTDARRYEQGQGLCQPDAQVCGESLSPPLLIS